MTVRLTPQSAAILTASNIGDSIQYSLASHLFTATYNPWFLENFQRGLNSDNPQTIHKISIESYIYFGSH